MKLHESQISKSQEIVIKYLKKKSSFYSYYPMNGLWEESLNEKNYTKAIKELKEININAPINLYIHFPFCETQCLFCHCFTIISKNREDHNKMVNYILKEINLIKNIFIKLNFKPNIKEIHFGGGSPSNLSRENLEKIINSIKSLSTSPKFDEIALEIDPRYNIDDEKMIFFSEIGINRISFGIQDFDPKIGKIVNRINSFDDIKNLLKKNIREKFNGVNFDLIYGMPEQTIESWSITIDKAIELSPDRLAVYVWGFRPDLYPHMKTLTKYNRADLLTQYKMFNLAVKKFLDNGYEFIGIDHFVKKTDILYKAKKNNTLDRNAIGYTPGIAKDIIAVGPNSMSTIGKHYFQNHHVTKSYYEKLDKKIIPIVRGYEATNDDLIRRSIIFDIILKEKIIINEICKKFSIESFSDYFSKEINHLIELEKDGLININNNEIKLTEFGRVFQRHVCNAFDKFHHTFGYKYSRDFKDGKEAFNRKLQLGI